MPSAPRTYRKLPNGYETGIDTYVFRQPWARPACRWLVRWTAWGGARSEAAFPTLRAAKAFIENDYMKP